jgi:plasmid stabilization system protein ParE
MRIIWSKKAETDLYLNIGYIAKNSPQNAVKILSDVIELSNSLAKFPYMHPEEPVYNSKNVRYAVIYSYKMIYKIHEDEIRILRLFHTKQNPNKI